MILLKQIIAAFCSASFLDLPSATNNFVSSNFTPTLKSGLCLGPVFEISLYKGDRHRIIGINKYSVVAEIWIHTDKNNPSDENDIVRVQDDFGR